MSAKTDLEYQLTEEIELSEISYWTPSSHPQGSDWPCSLGVRVLYENQTSLAFGIIWLVK